MNRETRLVFSRVYDDYQTARLDVYVSPAGERFVFADMVFRAERVDTMSLMFKPSGRPARGVARVWFPRLVFVSAHLRARGRRKNTGLFVYAARGTGPVTPRSRVARVQYWNLSNDGRVCMGATRGAASTDDPVGLYWNTAFAGVTERRRDFLVAQDAYLKVPARANKVSSLARMLDDVAAIEHYHQGEYFCGRHKTVLAPAPGAVETPSCS